MTLELVNTKYINEDDNQIFYYDNLFENLLKDKDLMTIIHYIVPRVISRKFCDEGGSLIDNKFGYFKNSIMNNINKLLNTELEWNMEFDLYSKDKEEISTCEFEK